MTPSSRSPSFFVDRDARTPSTSPFGGLGHCGASDSEGTPLRMMAVSPGARFGMPPTSHPVMRGRLSAYVEAQEAKRQEQAREALAARRDDAPPTLLGRARPGGRQPPPPPEQTIPGPAPDSREAAAAAREAFFARRGRLAEREAAVLAAGASGPGDLPTLLGGRAPRQPQPRPPQPQALAEATTAAELAQKAFLARRAHVEAREAFVVAADTGAVGAADVSGVPAAQKGHEADALVDAGMGLLALDAPLPVLLGRRAPQRPAPPSATIPTKDQSDLDQRALAVDARDFFLARRRAAEARDRAQFVV